MFTFRCNSFTLSIWFKRLGNGADAWTGTGGIYAEPLITKGRGERDANSRDMNYFLGIEDGSGALAADFEEGETGNRRGRNHPVIGATPVPNGVWVHAAVTYDGTWRLYLNGELDGELVVNQPPREDSIQPAAIAAALNSSGTREGYLNGLVDEARISSVVRSPAWVKASWLNVVSNDTFLMYGDVEPVRVDLPQLVMLPATDIQFTSAMLNANVVSTGSSETVVWFFWGDENEGTNAGAWQYSNVTTVQQEGVVSMLATGLIPEVVYHCRARGNNASGSVWTASSKSFIAGVHPLTLSAGEGGAVSPNSGWYRVGSTVTVAALPDAYYDFLEWAGDVPDGMEATTPLDLVMDGPKTLSAAFTLAGTEVGGTLVSNAIWNAEDSAYIVTGNLVVASGVTLSIEPGTTVSILNGMRIEVHGTLLAEGMWDNPIRFENHPTESQGGYLVFDGQNTAALGATGVLRHCEMTGLYGASGMLSASYAWLNIEGCTFSNMVAKVLHPSDSRVRIVDNVFSKAGECVNVVRCAGVIASNQVIDVLGNADALDVDYSWTGPGDGGMVLEWNRLQGGVHPNADAIDVAESSCVIRYNTISNFSDKGISIGPTATPFVHNNLIRNCSIGIEIKDSSDPLLVNNTIIGCTTYGIHSYIKGENGGGPALGTAVNMILWDCVTDVLMEDESTLDMSYSLADAGGAWPGVGNIATNPHFSRITEDDFRLSSESPCVEAGTNQAWMVGMVDYAGNDRIYNGTVDMGAIERFPFGKNGTPEWWLESVGLTNDVPDVLELDDPDGDGALTWEEYVAGTVPTNTLSVFRISNIVSVAESGSLRLSWYSISNHYYSIQSATNPGTGWWPVVTNLSATPPVNVYTGNVLPGVGMFRVLVEP
jgi:parallel beta-helix repeat protein